MAVEVAMLEHDQRRALAVRCEGDFDFAALVITKNFEFDLIAGLMRADFFQKLVIAGEGFVANCLKNIIGFEDRAQPPAHDSLVVGEEHADRRHRGLPAPVWPVLGAGNTEYFHEAGIDSWKRIGGNWLIVKTVDVPLTGRAQ